MTKTMAKTKEVLQRESKSNPSSISIFISKQLFYPTSSQHSNPLQFTQHCISSPTSGLLITRAIHHSAYESLCFKLLNKHKSSWHFVMAREHALVLGVNVSSNSSYTHNHFACASYFRL